MLRDGVGNLQGVRYKLSRQVWCHVGQQLSTSLCTTGGADDLEGFNEESRTVPQCPRGQDPCEGMGKIGVPSGTGRLEGLPEVRSREIGSQASEHPDANASL